MIHVSFDVSIEARKLLRPNGSSAKSETNAIDSTANESAISGKLKPRVAERARFGEGILCIRCIYTVFLTDRQHHFSANFLWAPSGAEKNGEKNRPVRPFGAKKHLSCECAMS
jgi:hypothetical protein